ncbi:hypothetical protein HHK36_005711 [Tetracentron sinense]|uniref:Ubiquitin-specific protease family C19-related protein n=1 Tax=Tetracentron sinense TaxID=13715 RepID=A0A835DMI7_TETSI|nr:hypothetical protein HHK36_005711 [Tetracentron sinense]
MGTRIPSHQLSNGLYVSGRPEQFKDRQPTMGSRAVPYTGGDIKKSGELGKMFDISGVDSSSNVPPSFKPSRHSSSSQHNSGSFRSASNSGPLTKSSNSGPLQKKLSGSMSLQPTGLITSGPLGTSSGGGTRRSAQLELSGSIGKAVYSSAVTSLNEEVKFGFRVPKAIMWVFLVVVMVGLLFGVFMIVTVKKTVMLLVIGAILVPVPVVLWWNFAWGKKGLLGFLRRYPNAELRDAKDGQLVKVTGVSSLSAWKTFVAVAVFISIPVVFALGLSTLRMRHCSFPFPSKVVTCGSIPLESSYQKIPRCVYVATELYEYRGWGGKSANSKHRPFSWGSRHSELLLIGMVFSLDVNSGLRALVKAGYGAKVAPFVKPATVIDITKENRELSPTSLHWLAERNLSSDDRIMRLKEGYIKEGSTVSVMGVLQRHDNLLMIVPSADPVSTGCQWIRCLIPTYIIGLILKCDEGQNDDVIPVQTTLFSAAPAYKYMEYDLENAGWFPFAHGAMISVLSLVIVIENVSDRLD